MTDREFAESAKKTADFGPEAPDGLHGAYYLYGTEGFLLREAVKRAAAAIPPSAADFCLVRFSCRSADWNSIAEAAETYPFIYPMKLIILEDFDSQTLKAEELTALKGIIEELPETTVLLMAATSSVPDNKKNSKAKSFLTYMNKKGTPVAFDKKDIPYLAKYILSLAKKGHAVITPEAAYHLIELTEGSMEAISTEMGKLTAMKRGDEITSEDIDTLTVPTVESSVYELSKAMLAGSADKTMQILDSLFADRAEPIVILSVLAGSIIDLIRAKAMRAGGVSLEDGLAAFDYRGRDFRLKNALRDCGRFSDGYLSHCLDVLSDTDLALKASRADPRILLELALTEMLTVSRR